MAENQSSQTPNPTATIEQIPTSGDNNNPTAQHQFGQQPQQLYQVGSPLHRTPSASRLNNNINNNNNNNNNNNIGNNNSGGVYGQMSFAQQQQHQQQGINNNNNNNNNNNQNQFSRSMLMGNLGLQPQLLSPRQKSGVLQGTQFNTGANSAGQTLQNMQAMGMINPLNINPQMRTNGTHLGSLTQQQRMNLQIRQQLLHQASLTSNPKLAAQGLQRTPYMNAQLSGLTQNGQSPLLQNSVSQQQQWSRQMPAMSTPNTSSYRVQQQRQQQQPSSLLRQQSNPSQQNSMGLNLNPQQLSQIAQQHQLQAQVPPQQMLNQHSHSSPRMSVAVGQRSVSLTGSQPDATVSGNTTPGVRSSQGTESSNQLLGKRKIQDLVSQVDPRGRLDPDVEDLLLELADDFIDSVTTFACSLAKHRNSTTLESKDVLLHLEKNWNLTVPGFSSEERKNRQNPVSNDIHKKRLDAIRSLMEPSQSEAPINIIGKDVSRQGIMINQGGVSHMMGPSPSSDQLVSQSNTPQMVQQMNRF